MSERPVPNCMDHWLKESPLPGLGPPLSQKEREMNESNKMYVLGYNDGVERAAQQCRFYADMWEKRKDTEELLWKDQSMKTLCYQLEGLILMLQMDSFKKKTLAEVFEKVVDG